MKRYLLFIQATIFLASALLFSNPGSGQGNNSALFQQITGMEDNSDKVNRFLSLSLAYRFYNLDSALICCDNALAIAQKINYQEGVAESYYKKCLAYNKHSDANNAIAFAYKALDVAESISDEFLVAKVNYMLGNIIKKSVNNLPALGHFKTALKIYLENEDSARANIVYNGIGNFFMSISLYDSAAIYYHKYLDNVNTGTDPLHIAKVHSNLGKVNRMLNEYDIARDYFDMAYPVIKSSTDYEELGILYNKMGSLEVDVQNYSMAKIYFLKADSVYRKNDDTEGVSNCLVNMAALNLKQELYDLSIARFDSAMHYYREFDNADGMIVVWEGKATVYLSRGSYDTALIYCDSSLNLARQTKYLKRQEEILEKIIEIYSDMGNWEDATHTLFELQELEDSIYNLTKTITINELRIRYNREKDQLKILNLETEKLQSQNDRLRLAKQRNIFLYSGIGSIVLALGLFYFFRYRARKNQIIAEQKIQQLEEEKKLMAARFLVEGQENERKRIASAIHDSLGVLLSTSKMHITAIKDDNPENRALIEKATKFLDEANTEMRKISHNMMPGALSKLGLCEALEDLFETLDETEGIDARMEVLGPKERLPENQEIMIYRVVQEMVNNTLKHSKADRIDLTLVIHPDELDLSYSDNGKGFDAEEVKAKKTMGIQSIRSRVKFLDGIIKIDSSPGKGVVYRISVPVDANKGLTSV